LEDERERISKTKSTLSEDAKKQNEVITQLTGELLRSRGEFEKRQAEMSQMMKFLNEDKIMLKEKIEESKRLYTRQIEDLKMVSNI
jgi:septal ring factor EnvC (AmiA/AmiB activator)